MIDNTNIGNVGEKQVTQLREERRGGAKAGSGRLLSYALLPVALAALILTRAAEADIFLLLQQMLILILGYIAAVYDLFERRVPNKLILIMIAAWVLMITPKLFLDTDAALLLLKDSAIGFATGGGLFMFMYLVSHKGVGGGDVKFMAGAGLYLGFSAIMPSMLYGTILAALTALILIAVKKITRKDKIPLIPFLYAGILLTLFFQEVSR